MTDKNGTLLFHNTMRIREGRLDEFQAAVVKAVDFVREHGPQLMVEVFIDAEAMVAHSFQLYADDESVLRHWELSDPYIREVMEHCTVERFEVFGHPGEQVRTGLHGPTGESFPTSITPRLTGFTRLTARP
ncbi:hypothetical protein [Actinokineospora fastidiosa]|uniref:ABM domain-containing protein n=1 Tax=Actinokineospora fastidiosa TaxID=1816 RepID=A0A918GDG0_9PSEU|nr:hypothetical protein [Actinokineospora fastidiosa]GGS29777.1 hypothetical protein GCM10010171_23910 [Actinokineospora fastidiosa]